MTADELAQIIRTVDANHDLGAELATRMLEKWNTRAPSPWHDIATAPSDAVLILGWWHGSVWKYACDYAHNTRGGWRHGQATHWQPLPEPPK